MRYHKIKNVDINVCTAEQKIAYNAAFRIHINYNHLTDIKVMIDNIFVGADMDSKYDIDLIKSILYKSLTEYLKGNFILTSYEEVGKTFPKTHLQ